MSFNRVPNEERTPFVVPLTNSVKIGYLHAKELSRPFILHHIKK
jgi:hypothetical protein